MLALLKKRKEKKKQENKYLQLSAYKNTSKRIKLIPLDLDLISLLIKSHNCELGNRQKRHSDVLPTGSMLEVQVLLSYYMDQLWNQISCTQCKFCCSQDKCLALYVASFLFCKGEVKLRATVKPLPAGFPCLGRPTLGTLSQIQKTPLSLSTHMHAYALPSPVNAPFPVCLNCYCEHSAPRALMERLSLGFPQPPLK